MTLDEIKSAVLAGKTVCWANEGYEVVRTSGQWLIVFTPNGSAIGLTWRHRATMNGKPHEFFIKEGS